MNNPEPELLPPDPQPTFQPGQSMPHLKPTETKLARLVGSEVARPEPQALSIENAYQAVITGNLDSAKLAVLKDLLAMDAQRRFDLAFAALQADLPVIVAKTVIPNRGKYERYEDLLEVVGPLLSKHKITLAFSQEVKENRIVLTCILSHAGHTRTNGFAVRTGGKSDSDTQADCKAATTAKRNALCNALNIVIRQDVLDEEHDATIEGDPNAYVTREQAEELSRRVAETNSNREAFLQFCGAKSFFEIPASRYAEADAMMRRKENRK
jgi:hypothetical protein